MTHDEQSGSGTGAAGAPESPRDAQLRALAHDMRTPLTVVSLNAELLEEVARTRGDQTEIARLQAILDAVGQLRQLARAMGELLRGEG